MDAESPEETFFEYTMSSWNEYVDKLAAEPLRSALFVATQADAGGWQQSPFETESYWETYLFRESRDGSDVVQLVIKSKEKHLFADSIQEAAVVAFLDRMMWQSDADYAEGGFGYGDPKTCVEFVTHRYWHHSKSQARETLRGYSWLTMVPAPLVSRVGGVAGLRASGAFFEVRELPNGAVLLRATEHFRDYRNPEATRVFEMLRPVLPPDTPPSAFRYSKEFNEISLAIARGELHG